jgi:hypothetical protein
MEAWEARGALAEADSLSRPITSLLTVRLLFLLLLESGQYGAL